MSAKTDFITGRIKTILWQIEDLNKANLPEEANKADFILYEWYKLLPAAELEEWEYNEVLKVKKELEEVKFFSNISVCDDLFSMKAEHELKTSNEPEKVKYIPKVSIGDMLFLMQPEDLIMTIIKDQITKGFIHIQMSDKK